MVTLPGVRRLCRLARASARAASNPRRVCTHRSECRLRQRRLHRYRRTHGVRPEVVGRRLTLACGGRGPLPSCAPRFEICASRSTPLTRDTLAVTRHAARFKAIASTLVFTSPHDWPIPRLRVLLPPASRASAGELVRQRRHRCAVGIRESEALRLTKRCTGHEPLVAVSPALYWSRAVRAGEPQIR